MNKLAVDIGNSYGSPIGQGDFGFAKLVSIVLSNALVAAGIIMLFLMIGGGIAIISGAGKSSPETAARGRSAVTAAAIGFIIIFAVYWMVQIAEIVTGVNILNPGL